MERFGKTTRYFTENVIKKRPYIKPEWIDKARKGDFLKKEIQPDGRVRIWVYIQEKDRYLRVAFLEDGETLHNAFFDRSFKGGRKR